MWVFVLGCAHVPPARVVGPDGRIVMAVDQPVPYRGTICVAAGQAWDHEYRVTVVSTPPLDVGALDHRALWVRGQITPGDRIYADRVVVRGHCNPPGLSADS